MAINVGMHEAKTTLSRLVDAAQSGEEVVITRRGKPVVRLEPVSSGALRKSLYGSLKGQIKIADDFDELPDDIAKAFGMIVEVVRNGAPVAELSQPARPRRLEGEEWRRFVASLPSVDEDFAHDIREARKSVGPPAAKWPVG